MPDVGVLQLKIAANVSSATTSLKTLSDRLSAINKATENFQLGNVAAQIQQIVDTVKGDKSVSTAVKNLGSLLNAISGFSKVTKIGLNKTQIKQLSDLQTAVNGFNLGNSGTQLNKIREALGGEWNTEQAAKAKHVLDTLAQGAKSISDSGTAEKIKDVSKSLGDITGGTAGNVSKATDEIVDYQKVVNELGDTLKNAQVTFKEPLMRVNLGQFGEKPTSIPQFENASVQSWRDEMAGIRGVNDELKQTDATSINNIGDLQRALSELGKIKGADGLIRFADGINAITAAMQSSGESYLTLGRLASAINKFKDATSGFSIPSFAKLESLARTLQENFNAENGLKRMADGINAFKAATQGMDLSNAKGISAILKSMNANASQSSGTVSAMKAVSDSISTASSSNTSSGFAETSERISEVSGSAKEAYGTMENLNTLIQQTGWTAGDTSGKFREMFETWNEMRRSISLNAGSPVMRLMGGGVAPENALSTNVQTGEAWKPDWTNGENFETGFQMLRQHGEDVIEVTGTVKDELGNVISETKEASESFNGTADALDRVRSSTENAQSGIDMFGQTIEINREMADKYRAYGRTLEDVFNGIYNGKKRDVDLMSNWLHGNGTENEQLFALQHTASQFGMTIDELKSKIAEFKAAENQISQDTGAGAEVRFQKIDNAIEGVISRFSELVQGTGSLKGSISRMFPTLSGLFNRFKQLVKYRALRAVIKQISEGFQEGTENYYYYSQAIGGTFATSMDNAASSLLTMKNSIGAAVAPLISSLIPYLQTVVNLFIEAVNYVNQFFALMNGQSTWSKATAATATAFDDISDSASGASDSINDLLADWDELNIIQSESSGSGSGTGTNTAEDYASMFEEVSDYNETIKNIVDFIKENFDEILTIVEEIGAALLLWKFSNAFSGLIGNLAGLAAAGLTAAVIFEVSTLFNNQYLKTGDIGWLVADVLSTLIGTVLMKKILSKVLGGQLATLAIPIALTVSAIAGITTIIGNNDVSALSKEALIATAENSLKTAFAAGYLLKNVAGFGTTASALGGLGVGLTTFGVVIGLKAIAQTMDTKEFTGEIIGADFLAAGLVGTGIALTEWALGGSAISALTLGGGAALFTLGALIGVQALLTLSEKSPIQWGDYAATEEEIRAFIDEEVFSGAPKAQISLANATIEELGENKTSLEEAASTVIGTLHSVRLGLVSSSEVDLKTEVADLVSKFNATSKSYQDALKISVDLVPVSNSDGGETIVENSESRWGELNGIMSSLAEDLTKQFDIAYDENLDEVTRKNAEASIEKISNMMTQIADAVSSGQAKAKIANGINMQISNLTEDAMDQMLDYYKEQRDALIAELTETSTSAAEGLLAQYYAYDKLAEYALKDAGGNTEDATYQHYLEQANKAFADYQERIQTIQSDAEAEADKVLGDTEGAKKIRQTLLEKVAGLFPTDQDMAQTLASGGRNDIDLYSEYVQGLLSQISSGETDNSELKNDLAGVLDGILYDLVGGDNVEEYRKAIENGIIGYGDLFGSDFASKLTDALGISNLAPELQAQWQELINEFFPEQTVVADPTTIEVPIGTSLSEGFFGREETTFELGLETDTINLKDQIQSDLNNMDPVTVPTNADITVNKSGQQTASAGLASIPLAEIGSAVMTNLTSVFSQLAGENGMFGTITINTERNDEQDTNNIAEGTKRGTVGLESKQSQTNSYMAQAVSYLATIAANSGGGAGVGGSQAGYLITNALNQFAVVSNGVR